MRHWLDGKALGRWAVADPLPPASDLDSEHTVNRDDAGLGEFWASMREKLADALEAIVPPQSIVAYVDYPLYRNIGDLMIWLGTERWMTESGLQVLGRWHIGNFRFPRLRSEVAIVLQGGGNFGDLYAHQSFREEVVRRYPRNRIVFLPQTMYFARAAHIETAARILNGHTQLHLMLRDRNSFERAQSVFYSATCHLAPDMAVFLHPIHTTLRLAPRLDPERAIYLLRQDRERSAADDAVAVPHESWAGDWLDLMGWHRLLLRAWQAVGLMPGAGIAHVWFAQRWYAAARNAVRHCADGVNGADRVVTSRLHGHILASLLGVHNALLDSRHGKNSSYFDCWHLELKIAELRRAAT